MQVHIGAVAIRWSPRAVLIMHVCIGSVWGGLITAWASWKYLINLRWQKKSLKDSIQLHCIGLCDKQKKDHKIRHLIGVECVVG